MASAASDTMRDVKFVAKPQTYAMAAVAAESIVSASMRGGKRTGAGRKPAPPECHGKPVLVYLQPHQVEFLDGVNNKSKFIQSILEEKFMSDNINNQKPTRDSIATITKSWWTEKDKNGIQWLCVTTDLLGNRIIKLFGSKDECLITNKIKHDAEYPIGSKHTLGSLSGIPVAEYVLANIANGHNISVGIMRDGLEDTCGILCFAKYYDYNNIGNICTPLMKTVSEQAAEIFALEGKDAAKRYLNESGLFKDIIDEFGGLCPSKDDLDIWELR